MYITESIFQNKRPFLSRVKLECGEKPVMNNVISLVCNRIIAIILGFYLISPQVHADVCSSIQEHGLNCETQIVELYEKTDGDVTVIRSTPVVLKPNHFAISCCTTNKLKMDFWLVNVPPSNYKFEGPPGNCKISLVTKDEVKKMFGVEDGPEFEAIESVGDVGSLLEVRAVAGELGETTDFCTTNATPSFWQMPPSIDVVEDRASFDEWTKSGQALIIQIELWKED